MAKLAKLEGWTFKVSSYTFDAIYKTRAEMMEEEKEEAAQGAATPPPILPALPPLPIPSDSCARPLRTNLRPITVQQPKPADPNKVVTSDIIKVPSAEEMKKGAKIEVIKKEDLPAEIEKAKEQSKRKRPTIKNSPSAKRTIPKPPRQVSWVFFYVRTILICGRLAGAVAFGAWRQMTRSFSG